jgi:hypothetical protein
VKNRDFPRAVSDLPPFRSLLEFALRPEKWRVLTQYGTLTLYSWKLEAEPVSKPLEVHHCHAIWVLDLLA